MHRLRRRFLLQGLIALDALAIAVSLLFGLFLAVAGGRYAAFRDFLLARASLPNAALIGAFLLVSQRIFDYCGLYRSRRLAARRELYHRIVRAVSITTLLLGVIGAATARERVPGAVFRVEVLDLPFLAAFWSAAVATVAAQRAGVHRVLEGLRRRGRNLRHVLIVGNGPRGRWFAESLESRPELGYRVLGFLDDAPAAPGAPCRLLGGIGDLGRLLRTGPVDEVAVMLPIKTFYSEVARIVSICEEQGVVVRLPADLFNARLAQVESEQFEDLRVLTLFTVRGSAPAFLIKRLADVVLSAASVLVTAPLWALIAVAIRLDSPGPVLFQQLRVGQNGRRFRIWKFRTMITGAEARQPELEHLNEARGAAFKIRDDPRATRFGRWLRRTSLDELPQLINVLTGDMSLVGPRPLPLRDAERLSEDWQRRRFSVRPGLTCLWQAGGRHALAFEDWMRLDLDYIDNWSLLLDLKILLRTVPAVWTGVGAS